MKPNTRSLRGNRLANNNPIGRLYSDRAIAAARVLEAC